ncbi:hypothetical protein RYX36_006912, partial [Vicia faba]
SPKLANDIKGTIETAKWVIKMVACTNVYIKIPAIDESIPSIKEFISLGIGVNATICRVDVAIDKKLEQIGTVEALDLTGKA